MNISPAGLTVAKPAIHERSYSVRYHRDHRPECAGEDWRLYITGRGHWMDGSNGTGGPGFGGTFRSEAEAHEAGRLWVARGGR